MSVTRGDLVGSFSELSGYRTGLARAKGLPLQSRKTWIGRNEERSLQAAKLVGKCKTSLVVDYTHRGYFAAEAQAVAAAQGVPSAVGREGELPKLATALRLRFADCEIGRVGLLCEPRSESFIGSEEGDECRPM